MAQRRWRILARALTGSPELAAAEAEQNREQEHEEEIGISVRRFTSFDLLKKVRLKNNVQDPESVWYEYTALLEGALCSVQIRHVSRAFTANELIGFNNTGNVCVWPSEECLAYYLLKNPEICQRRRVLELGGGMSCLAGVFVAKYCEPSSVTLTDGNLTSVENVARIVERNGLANSRIVESGVVQWARAARMLKHRAEANGNRRFKNWRFLEEATTMESPMVERVYDVVLCADCLFFDEDRLDLVETIYGWLAVDGVALVMAPRRGATFQKFAAAALERGFTARQIERYDAKVWSRHLELLDRSQEYCPDLHYPLLLELTKQKKTPPG